MIDLGEFVGISVKTIVKSSSDLCILVYVYAFRSHHIPDQSSAASEVAPYLRELGSVSGLLVMVDNGDRCCFGVSHVRLTVLTVDGNEEIRR